MLLTVSCILHFNFFATNIIVFRRFSFSVEKGFDSSKFDFFFPKIFLKDETVRVLLFSKIVKVQTSVKTLKNSFRNSILRGLENWNFLFTTMPESLLYDHFFEILFNFD